MALRRSDERGDGTSGLSRAQTLDLCARLASYSEADATSHDLLSRAGVEAVQRFPDDAEVLVAVGRMFLACEELRDAERVLRRAVRFAPQDPHALRMLGEVLLRCGDPGAAHAALSSAVACGMNDPWTKTWVARALDYSDLLEDLGREGIAADVRQVLGKPGQGPADDERKLASLAQASPPARAYSRKGILGRIDKGVFFAGDARAEPPSFGAGHLRGDDIVDLPTPIPDEPVAHDAGRSTPTSQRPTITGEAPAETTRTAGPRRSAPELAAPTTRMAGRSGGAPEPAPAAKRTDAATAARRAEPAPIAKKPAAEPAPAATRRAEPAPAVNRRAEPAPAVNRRAEPAPIAKKPTAEPAAVAKRAEPAPAAKNAPKGRASAHESSPEITIETVLSDDAAWGGPGSSSRGGPGSAPRSEPMPPSDTEISAWVPDMEAFARDRRSAPVQLRGSAPPPARESAAPPHHESAPPPLREEDRRSTNPGRIAPPPPGLPRLDASELYDEFTEHKRPFKSVQAAVEEALAEKAKRRGPPPLPAEPARDPRAEPEPDPRPRDVEPQRVARASAPEPQRSARTPVPVEPQRAARTPADPQREARRPADPEREARRPVPAEPLHVRAPIPAAPPPMPVESATLLTGKGGLLPDRWAPSLGAEPAIHVLDHDHDAHDGPEPVTAPPSALIPMDAGPVTAPPSALIPLDPEGALGSAREASPPSAAFPPEPPSLQVPSKALLGGGLRPTTAAEVASRSGATGARASAPPAAPAAAAIKAPAKPRAPLSRLQTLLLRAVVGVAVVLVLLGGYQLYKRNRTTKMRVFAAQAAIALHTGGPRGVADAEAAIASAKKLDAKSRAVALGVVRVRVFAVLDVDPARVTELQAAVKDASALGVSASDLAFAEIVSHLATGDVATAMELITHNDEDPDRAGDALFQLAAGATLETSDPAASIERYRAALKIDEDYLSIAIRLTRALAFSERGAEANDRLQALLLKWPGRPELSALAAVVAMADPARAANAKLDPATDVDMLPRPLRAVARILAKGTDEQAVAKATAEADIAPVIVLCGEAALRGGHEASAREAAQHAIEIAPSYAPAYALIARTGLASARFEEARQAALRAPPEVAAEVLSFIAYESGDAAAMVAAAGRHANGPLTDPIPAGLARLRGAGPLGSSSLTSLAKSGRFWADVVAMDGALDAGELEIAQTIADGWPGADKHPIRAARLARLFRYQGKNGLAQAASTSAAPTLAARIEGALSAAEMASARDAAVASLGAGRAPEERWALAFLLAREGRAEAAHAAMNSVTIPEADAPFLTRRVAALALAELHISNPSHPMYVSFNAWRRNPDVARALGIALPTAAEAAGEAPPVPEKPVLKGRIPRPGDNDPY